MALGGSSEVEAFAASRPAGYRVCVPVLGHDSPYDCVIDDGTRLHRVQIKTGYVDVHDSVRFATRSTSYHRGGGSRTYRDTADPFAVWVPELARCYLVPVSESALRLVPARNGQTRRTRPAADYELGPLPPRPSSPRAVRPGTS